jgi:hypothetical protein
MDEYKARAMDQLSPHNEYRITASTQGGEYVMDDIKGERELYVAIEQVRNKYPTDTLYVRQVLETVVMVIAPDGTVTKL